MRTIALFFVLSSLVASGQVRPSRPDAPGAACDARLLPLVPRLKRQVEVPVRLPRSLGFFRTARRAQLYLSVSMAAADGYEVRIEHEGDCGGANHCFVGSISGQSRTEANKDFLDAIIAEGKVVRLANGVAGYYFEGPCGASCVPDSLMWRQDGFYYVVTSAGAGAADGIARIADSMIAGRPVNQ